VDRERPTPLRILVADDHELVRSGVACVVERCGYTVVGQAGDGIEALALWRELRPDVALLDLRMPGLDGIAAVRAIRELDTDAKLILLTSFDTADQLRRGLAAGANGYALKGISPNALCDCIETVARGGRYLTPEQAQRIAEADTSPAPSKRELEVLAGIAQGLCNKLIARELDIGEGTVKVHIKSILRKLDAASRTHAALIAIRRGLVQV